MSNVEAESSLKFENILRNLQMVRSFINSYKSSYSWNIFGCFPEKFRNIKPWKIIFRRSSINGVFYHPKLSSKVSSKGRMSFLEELDSGISRIH